MSIAHEPIFHWLAQYAYEPQIVYMLIFGMMIASGFGFPLPEEVTIISVGILAYMGSQPQQFPPPSPGAPVVNGYEAAIFTSLAVMFADFLVFYIGRLGGRKLIRRKPFTLVFTQEAMAKVDHFTHKHGQLGTFLFRFTPGLRFPAHIMLGMSSMPFWKFALVDGAAVMVSIPTQILLIYNFGEPILVAIHRFKYILFTVLAVLAITMLTRRFLQLRAMKNQGQL